MRRPISIMLIMLIMLIMMLITAQAGYAAAQLTPTPTPSWMVELDTGDGSTAILIREVTYGDIALFGSLMLLIIIQVLTLLYTIVRRGRS